MSLNGNELSESVGWGEKESATEWDIISAIVDPLIGDI